MLAERDKIRGFGVLRHLVPVIGVVSAVAMAALSAGPSRGQTNIDQGKPASELFANYCAVCHKSTRGLANGRNSLTLSMFLHEHYAASSQQAAALAAYVISAGGNAPAAKPERAKSEEPKGQEAKTQDSKGAESKGQESRGHEAKPRAASASPKSEPEKPPRLDQPGREEDAPTQPEPAAVVAAPAPSPAASAAQAPELPPTTTSAGASNDAPVPRDNIPD